MTNRTPHHWDDCGKPLSTSAVLVPLSPFPCYKPWRGRGVRENQHRAIPRWGGRCYNRAPVRRDRCGTGAGGSGGGPCQPEPIAMRTECGIASSGRERSLQTHTVRGRIRERGGDTGLLGGRAAELPEGDALLSLAAVKGRIRRCGSRSTGWCRCRDICRSR